MSYGQCETCEYYKKSEIISLEGECTDPSKIIYAGGSAQNTNPATFDFSTCDNYKKSDD